MNTYSSLRKQNNGTMAAVIALVMCVVLSATVLLSRLAIFAAADPRLYIPLTRSQGITTVLEGTRTESGTISFRDDSFNRANHILLTAKPNMQVRDKDKVWAGETEVEIFKLNYDRDDNTVYFDSGSPFSVISSTPDKVVAPGTGNLYEFFLENTGNVPLDYTVKVEAWFGDEDDATDDIVIPIFANLKTLEDKYLLGSASTKAPVILLDGIENRGSVGVNKVIPYSLEWEWPFELNDEYDTWLGNLAVDQDITLTIRITTQASYSADPNTDDGLPKTGDDSQILVFGALMAMSAVMLVILLIPKRRQEENHA